MCPTSVSFGSLIRTPHYRFLPHSRCLQNCFSFGFEDYILEAACVEERASYIYIKERQDWSSTVYNQHINIIVFFFFNVTHHKFKIIEKGCVFGSKLWERIFIKKKIVRKRWMWYIFSQWYVPFNKVYV